MAQRSLAGARIRDRRVALGMRQVALAQAVGISASYLNLIEHNRRRIGGRLLVDLARQLRTDPTQLGEGAENALIEGLRQVGRPETAAGAPESAEQLAHRFPGWAQVILSQRKRIEDQQRRITGLTDRLAQDPELAASMHEVLSSVTAIRATAGILGTGEALDSDWLGRFHRNILEDSKRLAESARSLVAYLETTEDDGPDGQLLPQEELDRWLARRGYHVAELEAGTHSPAELAESVGDPAANGAMRKMLLEFLEQYRRDAIALPAGPLLEGLAGLGPGVDPLNLAAAFGVPCATVLRRLACLPPEADFESGLMICDSSGALIFRKPVTGFAGPRFGAACPLLPLFRALSHPGQPLRFAVEQSGYAARRFVAHAVAEPMLPPSYSGPQVLRATMLLVPLAGAQARAGEAALEIGPGCRLCPRGGCPARHEPSMLGAERP